MQHIPRPLNGLIRCIPAFAVVLTLAACGNSQSTPSTSDAGSSYSSVEATVSTSDRGTTSASTSDEENNISADEVEAAPTEAVDLALPGPEMPIRQSFHYASLNGTLVSWQLIDPATVKTCLTLFDRGISLRLHLENTVDSSYLLENNDMTLEIGHDDKPSESLTREGISTSQGYGEDIKLAAAGKTDEVLCAGIPDDADPATMTLVLGDSDHVQIRLPFAAAAPSEPGIYAEATLGKTLTFKDAQFTFPKVIATSGVWGDRSGGGEAKAGTRWVLIPTEVDNAASPHLFIEPNEITLEVDGQKLGQEMSFKEIYQAAPYGLEQGLIARGSLLFAVPDEATNATLHLKATSGSTDDVKVDFDLPREK